MSGIYYVDRKAFSLRNIRPYRVAFKNGAVSRNLDKEFNIKPTEVCGRGIDGGARVILGLPLDLSKELKQLRLITVANEAIVGLMCVNLRR